MMGTIRAKTGACLLAIALAAGIGGADRVFVQVHTVALDVVPEFCDDPWIGFE